MSTSNDFPYQITGNPGRIEVRQEIDDFVAEPEGFILNLFLQALARIQAKDQNERTSWFQIGGIHGMPYTPWDNVVGTKNGYCTHMMILFPTWHRVYVALMEQVVQDEMRIIAREYHEGPDDRKPTLRDKFCLAAERFRFPYWDWAYKPHLPDIVTKDLVDVQEPPYGDTRYIPNPLRSYAFHPVDPNFMPHEFKLWRQTLRRPGTGRHPQANDISHPDEVDKILGDEKNISHRKNLIYDLMFYVDDWDQMSNTSGGSNSLEEVHLGIHLDVGGDGHMGRPEVSGFDPIIWLHHNNVDRLLSIWQYLHPDVKMIPADSGKVPTATIPAHTTVDEDTDLAPFHIDDTNFWTSAKAYDPKVFGYTYPELGTRVSDLAGREAVQRLIKKTYGESVPFGLTSKASMANYKQWIVVASIKPSEFPSSGYIHIFLSRTEPTAPASEWLRHETRVGSISLFVNQSPQCDNCKAFRESNRKVSGQVVLTADLLKKGLDIDSVNDVETYLTSHIHWRCALVDDEELPLSAVPSLEVMVKSANVHKPDPVSHELPTREAFSVHSRVTHGKVGGFSIPE